MSRRSGLGKGLSALLPDTAASPEEAAAVKLPQGDLPPGVTAPSPDTRLEMVPVAEIKRNPYQPRTVFDDQRLAELTASVQEVGGLQPILVRNVAGSYEIVAGERRWLAARRAGLAVIPAVVREVEDVEALEQAVIENLHRDDLNPLEEAAAYHRLMDEFGMTQHQVAERVARSRSSVANALRLLHLPTEVQRLIMEGELTAGHARALASLGDRKLQETLAARIVAQGMSVRQIEDLVRSLDDEAGADQSEVKGLDPERDVAILEIEQALGDLFHPAVRVVTRGRRGRIIVEFADKDDLRRLFDLLTA